ncbi:MAG: GumC family protein [Lautropia sp.]
MNSPEVAFKSRLPRLARSRLSSIEEIGLNAIPTVATYLRMVRARKWLVGFITLLALVSAVFAVQTMTPIYRATSVLMVESSKSQVVSIQDLYAGTMANNRDGIQTQAEYIRSRHVANRTVAALGLDTHPYFDARQVTRSLWVRLASRLPLNTKVPQRIEPDPAIADSVYAAAAASALQAHLEVVPVRQSQLIEIRYESPDPALATSIANTIAQSYINADLDARFDMQQAASRWLNGRLDQLKRELERSEDALQKYRETAGIIITPGPTMGGNVRQLETATDRLLQARIARTQAEQIYRQVRPGTPNRYQVPAVFNNPAVAQARQAEAVAAQTLAERAQTFGTAHPQYLDAQVQLKNAQDHLQRQSEAVISSIAKEFEVARSTEASIERELNDSRSNIRELNRNQSELSLLERDVETNRKLYETFLSRVKETNATSDFMTPIARIIDPAERPRAPVKPRKLVIVALIGLLGAILGAALAIGIEMRSAVIRSVADVEEELGVGMLVAVPKARRGQLPILHRIQHDDSRSLIAEAVRTSVTDIRLLTHHLRCPVVGFTSAVAEEGKSTIAINFAIELSRKKRILLIDADLRKPSLAVRLGVRPSDPGLSDLILGTAPFEACLHRIEPIGLTLLPAGTKRDNPLDLLMSDGFRSHIEQMKGMFDLIVIDTPPIELVSDVLPIGRQCDGIAFVAKANSTPIPVIKRALGRLTGAEINLFGIILNAHDFARASRYYGEYSAQAKYGYYAGYGENSQGA